MCNDFSMVTSTRIMQKNIFYRWIAKVEFVLIKTFDFLGTVGTFVHVHTFL